MLLAEVTIPSIETHLAKQSSRLQKVVHPRLGLCRNEEGRLRSLIPVENWNKIKYDAEKH